MENLLTQYAVCSNCISRLWDLAGRIPSVSIVSQGVCASHGSPSIGLFTQVTWVTSELGERPWTTAYLVRVDESREI